MEIKTIFTKTEDEVKISGLLYTNKNKKIIISTHGMQTNGIKKRDEIIAKKVADKGYDYLAYNNRGREVVTMIHKLVDGKMKRVKAGTAYEDVTESYFDIKSVIMFCIENGYTEIILQGHSLGTIKTIYTYNRLKDEENEILEYIKGVILISMPDIPELVKYSLKDNYEKVLKLAEEKEAEGKTDEFMPDDVFICPVSVRNFLYYLRDEEINFIQLSNKEYDFKEINNIEAKLLILWGNDGELIIQKAEDLVEFMKSKIKNQDVEIDYIDGANHSYVGKEEELANRIYQFL